MRGHRCSIRYIRIIYNQSLILILDNQTVEGTVSEINQKNRKENSFVGLCNVWPVLALAKRRSSFGGDNNLLALVNIDRV